MVIKLVIVLEDSYRTDMEQEENLETQFDG